MSTANVLHDTLGFLVVRTRTMNKLKEEIDLLSTEVTQLRDASQSLRVNDLLAENMTLKAENGHLRDMNATLETQLLARSAEVGNLEHEQDRLIALLRSYDIDTTSQPRKRRAKRKPSTTDKLVAVEVE